MSGIQNFDFETHCSELSAKRKRKLTDDEYAALTLMMLSCDRRYSYTNPTTNPPTAQNIEDKINPATAVTNISERIAPLASGDDDNSTATIATTSERTVPLASSDDKKPVEPFSPAITASPLAKKLSYTCNKCGRSFSTGQALGGHKTSHLKRLPILAKKIIANTSESGASTLAENHIPCKKHRLDE
ncbi:zinc finger protein ZAT10-like [Forsythia ovata]|uniref:Zinc finger protein ZAT10-like n=1 Tax=Forsythia ovata TaxID=205694 RepID=A0ABD1TLI1_9LAMI